MVNHNHCSPRDCDEANRGQKKGLTSPSADSTYMTDLSQSDTDGIDSVYYSDGTTIIENKNWKESVYLKDELQGNSPNVICF